MSTTRQISGLLIIAKLIRMEQWFKNTLVFVPLFFSSLLTNIQAVTAVLGTMLLFCLISSCIYVFNDIRDVVSDRNHKIKQDRPLAANLLSIRSARLTGVILLLLSITAFLFLEATAFSTPSHLLEVLAVYVMINVIYSSGAKNIPLLELFMVASGFILRLIAGATVISVTLSPWILMCVGSGAMMLVVGKRRADISNNLYREGNKRKVLANYNVDYLDKMTTLFSGLTIMTYLLFCFSEYAVTR